MSSAAEREIRDALVSWFHANEPKARVVHELNVAGQGSNRADLGIVFPETLFLVEIKSEKDTLKRLREQMDAFTACSHAVIVAAHETHWEGDGLKGCDWMLWSHKEHLWRYPAPLEGWNLERYKLRSEPHAWRMLDLLWADELRAEIERHKLISPGTQMWNMTHAMTLGLTGRQIREAVCRQLRQRRFAEADPPMFEASVLAA